MLVTSLSFQLADVLLKRMPHGGAGRQPKRQPGAYKRVCVKQLELAAKLAVIMHRGLLADNGGERPKTQKPRALARGFGLWVEVSAPGHCPASWQHWRAA
jgi:hypothetical protein